MFSLKMQGIFLAIVCFIELASSIGSFNTNSVTAPSRGFSQNFVPIRAGQAGNCSRKYEQEICPDVCPPAVADRPGCMRVPHMSEMELEDTCFCGHKPYPPGPTQRFQYECIQANLVRGSRFRTTKENCKRSCRFINEEFSGRDFSPESGSPYLCFTEESGEVDAVCLCNDQKYAQTGGKPPNSGINLNFPKPQFPSTSSPWFTRHPVF